MPHDLILSCIPCNFKKHYYHFYWLGRATMTRYHRVYDWHSRTGLLSQIWRWKSNIEIKVLRVGSEVEDGLSMKNSIAVFSPWLVDGFILCLFKLSFYAYMYVLIVAGWSTSYIDSFELDFSSAFYLTWVKYKLFYILNF